MPAKPKGGVRQRLGLDARAEHPEEADAAADAERPAASSSSGLRGGVRKRLGVVVDEGGTPRSKRKCTGPLINTLKKQLAKGELSARQVEEIVSSSAEQGAEGLPKLASRSTRRISNPR